MKQLSYLVGALVAAVSLLPFCFLFLRSFWDGGVTLQPYYDVFLSTSRYLDSFWRSLGLTCTVAAGQLVVSVPAGFCFAKRSFPGKRVLAFLLVALLVLPVQVTLVPNYLMLKNLGLLNTYAALILPALFAPLGTFLLGQSFRSIPNALLDAARLDGCGTIGLLWRIVMPMRKGTMACVAILAFLDAWNMVEQPLAYLRSFQEYPLSVGLAYAAPQGVAVQMVCCLLAALPPLFLFAFFSQDLVDGIVLGEVK